MKQLDVRSESRTYALNFDTWDITLVNVRDETARGFRSELASYLRIEERAAAPTP